MPFINVILNDSEESERDLIIVGKLSFGNNTARADIPLLFLFPDPAAKGFKMCIRDSPHVFLGTVPSQVPHIPWVR